MRRAGPSGTRPALPTPSGLDSGSSARARLAALLRREPCPRPRRVSDLPAPSPAAIATKYRLLCTWTSATRRRAIWDPDRRGGPGGTRRLPCAPQRPPRPHSDRRLARREVPSPRALLPGPTQPPRLLGPFPPRERVQEHSAPSEPREASTAQDGPRGRTRGARKGGRRSASTRTQATEVEDAKGRG